MIVVISPAKTLDFETAAAIKTNTQPAFPKESGQLVKRLKKMSPEDLSGLMGISDKLASLNHKRYQTWKQPFTSANAKQALMAFKGDVYAGLAAETLTADDLKFAQKHLRILSGLYGVLRPLDLIQPYRLEMGTNLNTSSGDNLYQFWGDKITANLKRGFRGSQDSVLVNLASEEYFKSVDADHLGARGVRIVTPVFKEKRNGAYKIISFNAKKARGMMSRYIIKRRIEKVEAIKKFKEGGYSYDKQLSDGDTWVFSRS